MRGLGQDPPCCPSLELIAILILYKAVITLVDIASSLQYPHPSHTHTQTYQASTILRNCCCPYSLQSSHYLCLIASSPFPLPSHTHTQTYLASTISQTHCRPYFLQAVIILLIQPVAPSAPTPSHTHTQTYQASTIPRTHCHPYFSQNSHYLFPVDIEAEAITLSTTHTHLLRLTRPAPSLKLIAVLILYKQSLSY